MPTIQVTPELSKLIRDLRKTTNTTSKKMADLIKKSTGYISNVENGKTATIDYVTVRKMFDYFTEKDPTATSRIQDFFDNDIKVTPDGYEIYDSKHDHMKEYNIYTMFDKWYRNIHIENTLVEYFREELECLNISATDVIEKLNMNEGITDAAKYDENVLYIEHLEDGATHEIIVFNLALDTLNKIINRKIKESNYITLLGLVYALQLLKNLTIEEALMYAPEILRENKIYTLKERNDIMRDEEIEGIVSDINVKRIDRTNTKLPDNLSSYFNTLANLVDVLNKIKDSDTDYVNSKLKPFVDNLENYRITSMTLALMGLSLKPLEIFTPEEQISIFKEIKQLIDKKIRKKETPENLEIVKFDEPTQKEQP